MKLVSIFLLVSALLGSGVSESFATPVQPMYFYLYARVTDHVNLDLTEDQLRRFLPMVERYRKQYPAAHFSATVLFSGAVSQALKKRNQDTRIQDFVLDYIRRGVIEAGYDGSDEPTYQTRPVLDFSNASTAQERWMLREAAEKKFFNEGHDPLSGVPVPGLAGGLEVMRQVFGDPVCITGLTLPMKIGPGNSPAPAATRARLEPADSTSVRPSLPPAGIRPEVGGDTEAVNVLRLNNARIIMFGMPDVNPARLPGFRDARSGFSRLMGPAPETAPEVYWQDNILRSSEASNDVVHLIHASNGADSLKTLLSKADRSTMHVVHVQFADEQNYLQSPTQSPDFSALKYAYDHPDQPALPATFRRPKTELEAAYANEDSLLKWLAGGFFPSEQGSRIVSSSDLARMAHSSTGFYLSMTGLRAALAEYLKTWGNDTFAPSAFQAEGHYLSLADLFQVMTDALAVFHRSGKLPETVKVVPVYGPIRILTGHGPNEGDVTVESVASTCEKIATALHDESPGDIPKNAIPFGIEIDGMRLNAAQFLKLMARALVTPSPAEKLNVRMAYMFSAPGELYPKTRLLSDISFAWTLKPARLDTKATP